LALRLHFADPGPTRQELEEEVFSCTLAYCQQLCAQGQGEQAQWLVGQMAGVLKQSPGLFHMLGSTNFLLHRPMDAIVCFDRALQLDPHAWAAREALENLKSMACDRWHYRMLNDTQRNTAYARALEDCCARGARVLDIGTGTGILSLLAVRAGASEVTACDTSPVMCRLAEHCIKENSTQAGPLRAASEVISVVHASSEALCAGLSAGQFDVIVTELVDSGLLGEHMLPALRTARRCLTPGGTLIPRRAHVHAQVIECAHLRRRAAVGVDAAGLLYGLPLAPVTIALEEPYTCEPIYALPHTALTHPARVHTVDFHDLDASGPMSSTLLLPIIAAGRADAVVMWFDMELDERGVQRVSTSPERGAACGWDQGLFFLRQEDGDMEVDLTESENAAHGGCRVVSGESISLTVTHGDHGLHFSVTHPTWRASSAPLPAGPDTTREESREAPHRVEVGEQDMARLNDGPFHAAFERALASVAGRGGQHTLAAEGDENKGSALRVLCLEDGWSMRALMYARMPAIADVTAVQPNAAAARAMATIAATQGLARIEVVDSLHALLDAAVDATGDGGEEEEETGRFDVVVVDVCDGSGLLVPRALQALAAAATLAGPSLCVLPARVYAYGVLIESDWLCRQNRVAPESSLGLNLNAINAFGSTRYCDLDAKQFPHRVLTAPAVVHRLDMHAVATADSRAGPSSATETSLEVTNAGRVDAVLVWFTLFGPDATEPFLCTSSADPASHFRQCAMMVPGPLSVRLGQRVTLRAVASAEFGLHVECL
jgi:type II protein arginine methyltransferase